jgi:hypothetical protein
LFVVPLPDPMQKQISSAFLFLAVCGLFSCEPETRAPGKYADPDSVPAQEGQASAVIPEQQVKKKNVLLPRVLLLDKKGIPTDTLDRLSLAWLKRQYGSPSSFPGGIASLQVELTDTVLADCGTRKNSSVKLKPGLASLFDSLNTGNIYVGLLHANFGLYNPDNKTGVDFDDCDYSLLRFLRLRYLLDPYPVKVGDGTEELVNICAYRKMNFTKSFTIYTYSEDHVYPLQLNYWKEFWECEQRADYAPKYPFLGLTGKKPKVHLKMNDPAATWDDSLRTIWDQNPQFIPFILPLGDSTILFNPDSLSGKVKSISLETISGKKIQGSGIDLNHDNTEDIFWYIEERNMEGYFIGWITWMYLNIGGQWKCTWYRIHTSM